MISPRHVHVVRKIGQRLCDSDVNWAITGSLGLALQGVPVAVRDIDVLTDETGAYEIERHFAEFVTQKVSLRADEKMRSHFGVLTIDGITVEIIGDVETRRPDGQWAGPRDLTQHTRPIHLGGMLVRVLSLEHEYEAYRRLGRTEKVKLLGEWLRKKRQEG